MSTSVSQDLRFPIGRFAMPQVADVAWRRDAIAAIAETPTNLREAIAGWLDAQLDTPYRDGGWTVRQVVHHLADSHINAYTRFRLALTEENPTIKPYDEAKWAELPDARTMGVEVSLLLLDALHERWTMLLHAMIAADFARTLNHPERGPMTLDTMLGIYAWHGRHHVAHVTALARRMGW
jgi:uncharacterized damage-inducible protein DinB